MNEERLIAIFKLGQKIHMEELLYEGHVFMNNVSYFAKIEDDSPRSDPDEGTRYCLNADGATFRRKQGTEWQTIGSLSGAMRFRSDVLASANLYCLHARTERDYGKVFILDQLGFGDAYVLFLNSDEFLRRVQEAATKIGQRLQSRVVEYVDRSHYTGAMGIFRKFSEHAKDREFRIALLPGTGQPLSLRLGDLSDIAIMGSTNERLRLDEKIG